MGKEHKKPVAGTAGVGRKSHLLRGEGLRRRRPAEEGRASQPVQPRRPQLRRRLPAGRPQNGPALGLLNNWRAMEAAGGHTGPQNPTGEGAFDSDQLVEARRDRPDWGRFYYHRYWNNLPSRRSVQPTGPGPTARAPPCNNEQALHTSRPNNWSVTTGAAPLINSLTVRPGQLAGHRLNPSHSPRTTGRLPLATCPSRSCSPLAISPLGVRRPSLPRITGVMTVPPLPGGSSS
jgi:hypothetical protein